MEEILEINRGNLDNVVVGQCDLALEVEQKVDEGDSYRNSIQFELPAILEEYLIKNIKLMEELSNVIPLFECLKTNSFNTDKALSALTTTVDKIDMIHNYCLKIVEPDIPSRRLSRKDRIKAEVDLALKREMFP